MSKRTDDDNEHEQTRRALIVLSEDWVRYQVLQRRIDAQIQALAGRYEVELLEHDDAAEMQAA